MTLVIALLSDGLIDRPQDSQSRISLSHPCERGRTKPHCGQTARLAGLEKYRRSETRNLVRDDRIYQYFIQSPVWRGYFIRRQQQLAGGHQGNRSPVAPNAAPISPCSHTLRTPTAPPHSHPCIWTGDGHPAPSPAQNTPPNTAALPPRALRKSTPPPSE
jgi:hypothetical protein